MSSSNKQEYMKLISTEPIPIEKKREMANTSGLCMFLINLFILIPLWIGFLLPITIIYIILEKIFCMCCKKKKAHKEFLPLDKVSKKSKESREFDLVLFGATGFTGNFAAEYLAKNYTLGTSGGRVPLFGTRLTQRKS